MTSRRSSTTTILWEPSNDPVHLRQPNQVLENLQGKLSIMRHNKPSADGVRGQEAQDLLLSKLEGPSQSSPSTSNPPLSTSLDDQEGEGYTKSGGKPSYTKKVIGNEETLQLLQTIVSRLDRIETQISALSRDVKELKLRNQIVTGSTGQSTMQMSQRSTTKDYFDVST